MAKLREKRLLQANIPFWINKRLLEDGYYRNIESGDTDVYGNRIDRLSEVSDDPTYPNDGQIWQSHYKYWVHESGFDTPSSMDDPIIASGVTVDGTFRAKDSSHPDYYAKYDHHIDFENGRVVFTSGIDTSSNVFAEFSYKDVGVSLWDRRANEDEFIIVETIKDNPTETGYTSYPPKKSITLPHIFIQTIRGMNEAHEIGHRALINNFTTYMHVWSNNNFMLDAIEELFLNRERDVIRLINFNDAPSPLNSRNDINDSFTTYEDLSDVSSQYAWKKAYFDEIMYRKEDPLRNVERGRIEILTRIYPNNSL